MPLIFFAQSRFTLTYPAMPIFFYALTLLCPYFSLRLPCCAVIFLRTYPAVPLGRKKVMYANFEGASAGLGADFELCPLLLLGCRT